MIRNSFFKVIPQKYHLTLDFLKLLVLVPDNAVIRIVQ